jgi:hypothetical protein
MELGRDKTEFKIEISVTIADDTLRQYCSTFKMKVGIHNNRQRGT